MSAKDTIHQFLESVSDLSSLEVTTYTGKLAQAIDKNTGKIHWDAFRPDNGELVLVAATLVRPNLHTVNFRAEGFARGDLEALTELHGAAVESAQQGRVALTKMLLELVSSGADV
jgi:hypothetical protein